MVLGDLYRPGWSAHEGWSTAGTKPNIKQSKLNMLQTIMAALLLVKFYWNTQYHSYSISICYYEYNFPIKSTFCVCQTVFLSTGQSFVWQSVWSTLKQGRSTFSGSVYGIISKKNVYREVKGYDWQDRQRDRPTDRQSDRHCGS